MRKNIDNFRGSSHNRAYEFIRQVCEEQWQQDRNGIAALLGLVAGYGRRDAALLEQCPRCRQHG